MQCDEEKAKEQEARDKHIFREKPDNETYLWTGNNCENVVSSFGHAMGMDSQGNVLQRKVTSAQSNAWRLLGVCSRDRAIQHHVHYSVEEGFMSEFSYQMVRRLICNKEENMVPGTECGRERRIKHVRNAACRGL